MQLAIAVHLKCRGRGLPPTKLKKIKLALIEGRGSVSVSAESSMAAADGPSDGQVTRIGLGGLSGVGKSLLLSRIDGEDSCASRHANIKKCTLVTRDNITVKLLVCDLSGASQHVLAGARLYSYCSGLLMVFDLTDEGSFTSVINRIVQQRVANIPIVMVGNKCDQGQIRQISRDRIQIVCDEMEIEYIEVSAKERINVELAFERILELAVSIGQV